jgi:hypothetical protein
MRIASRLVALSAAFAFFTTSSFAATLSPGQGDVLVNRGTGYRPVKQTIEVSVGDQIMVKPKGEAHLTYPDGCTVLLRMGAVYTVTTNSPCVNKGNLYETPASVNAEAVFGAAAGVTLGMVLLSSKDKSASP